MRRFKFVDTKRFSPVIYGTKDDKPWSDDYFHKGFKQVTKEFLAQGEYMIDNDWWYLQKERCINGYTVKNAFLECSDGDAFTDETIKLDIGDESFYTGGNLTIKGTTVIFKDLGIEIKDGEVWIPGRMYFYLNFWKIKRLDDKKQRKLVLNPRFTDLSFENWIIRYRMKLLKLDQLWAKARQKGLSEEEACDMAYDYLFLEDSQSIILGGEDKYNENTMKMIKRGLDYLRNTQFYKVTALGGDNKDYILSKFTGSEVYSRTVKDNPEAPSGLSPSKVLNEEIGIWSKGLLKQVSATVNPSLVAEGFKTGYQTYTGTGGNMENGVADMEHMYYNPVLYNIMSFPDRYEHGEEDYLAGRFVPGYRFSVIDEDGNSRCVESIKNLWSEILAAAADQRYTKTVMSALKPSHIFLSESGGYFGKTISQWCNARKSYITTHKEAQVAKSYRLEWKNPNNWFEGVDAIYDEDGTIMISEMPEVDNKGKVYENLYRGATDSYDRDEANYSTSKGFCAIKKGFLNANKTYKKYVAYVLERPTSAMGGKDVFYENTAKLSILYNARNLIEFSNLLIFEWYEKNNLTSLLKLRPEFATANMVINSRQTNKYGIDPSTKPHWLTKQRKFLSDKANIDKCDFIPILEAWSRFKYDPTGKRYNCDITIGTSLCTVCEEDEDTLEVYSSSDIVNEIMPRYKRDAKGQLTSQY